MPPLQGGSPNNLHGTETDCAHLPGTASHCVTEGVWAPQKCSRQKPVFGCYVEPLPLLGFAQVFPPSLWGEEGTEEKRAKFPWSTWGTEPNPNREPCSHPGVFCEAAAQVMHFWGCEIPQRAVPLLVYSVILVVWIFLIPLLSHRQEIRSVHL